MSEVSALMTALQPEKVGVMGDTHGTADAVRLGLEAIAYLGAETVLHVGDFGLWQGNTGYKYLRKVSAALQKYGQTMYVTLGNHENYTLLDAMEEREDGVKFVQGFENILFLPRPFVWEWHDKKFMSVGGANSIDVFHRTPNIDWWEGERITYAEELQARAVGKVDVMITHDCPQGVDILHFGGGGSNPYIWSAEDVHYANGSRKSLRSITNIAKPEMLLHGHWHKTADITTTLADDEEKPYDIRTICMDMEYSWKGNTGLLTFEESEVVFNYINIPKVQQKIFEEKRRR